MLTVNIHEMKANLSYYLSLLEKGKRIVIAKRNVPIAELKLLKDPATKRELGQSKEKFKVPKKFFDPLPKSVQDSFNNPV